MKTFVNPFERFPTSANLYVSPMTKSRVPEVFCFHLGIGSGEYGNELEASASLLAKLVESRWVPTPESEAEGLACLLSVSVKTRKRQVDEQDEGYKALEVLKTAGFDLTYDWTR
ncbi:hypothetical protein D9758_018567 [Tetrapyrgos nigripes]|uniref:Uncharacterized protein n=1 Tax=Tetrapyrgos nigripes TaxID=182062 RepID=A0A8H5AVP8_9AGAR|nr:hypothetical protein D9758_018567 [Tetrapyrgos nigripes]